MKPYFRIQKLNQEYADLLPPHLSVEQLLSALRDAGDEGSYLVTEDDIAKYIVTMQSMPDDRKTLKGFLKVLPITVGRKVLSGRASKMLDFIMSRYPNPKVASVLHDWVVYLYTQREQLSPEDEIETIFDILEENCDRFHAYTIGIMMDSEDYQEAARRRYSEGPEALFSEEFGDEAFDAAAILLQSYYLDYALRKYKANHQARVANEVFSRMENTIQNQRTHLDRLNDKLNRASQHNAILKKELSDTQKTSEELLSEALEKIKNLEAQLEEERKQYAQDVADLFEQMSAIINNKPDFKGSEVKPLAGRVVAIIGDDSHKNSYREIIEDIFGGEMRFCSGIEISAKLRSTTRAADVIVLIIRYMQHKTEEVVKAEKRVETPIVRVNAAGVASFFKAIQEFVANPH